MGLIERAGAYIATITEAAYGETRKGLPQFVAKFEAVKHYATDPALLTHFKITEPAWVDWNFGEETTGYLPLFNHDGSENSNFKQIQTATGWTGADFQELSTLVGKSVLIRMEEDTYEGKTSLKVKWIDAPDASPDRTIKQADAPTIAAANSKWLKGRAAPAKPTTAVKPSLPAKSTASPVPASPPAVAGTAAPAAAAPVASVAPAAAVVDTPLVKGPPTRRSKKETAAAPVAPADTCTQSEAWDAVTDPAVKGNLDDQVVEDIWIASAGSVAPGIKDAEVTGEQWAKVRALVLAEIKARLA